MNFDMLVFTIPINWVLLLLVVPIAARLSDSSLPLWKERLWKLAVVAIAISLVGALLHGLGGLVAGAAATAVLWIFMWRWFDMEFRGIIILLLGQRILAVLAFFILAAAFH